MNRRHLSNENQMTLPFGQKKGIALSLEDRQKAFWFFASLSLLSLFAYIYAINAAAHHIAVRENLEREVAEINVRLSTLEFKSIELKNGVTLEVAKAYGFAEVAEPLYVSRNTGSALTLNSSVR